VLEVQELTKKYGRHLAVDSVSFKIGPGEIVGYLGPNGAGKSTTVKMLVGMIKPSKGRILFNGQPVGDNLEEFKKHIGYVPEEATLYSHLSGQEYLQLVGRLRNMEEAVLLEKIDSLLQVCQLHTYKYSPIISYSKGMKQKIMMLAAMLHNPDILILDEPFSGLDVSFVLVFRNLLKSLAAAGKTIIFSSHVLEITEKICSRVLVIHRSRLLADDSVEHLRDMMHVPSLEEIFQQLVQQNDYDKTANDILAILEN
jgi:ABC-2 type transport system ATP-binding protein